MHIYIHSGEIKYGVRVISPPASLLEVEIKPETERIKIPSNYDKQNMKSLIL